MSIPISEQEHNRLKVALCERLGLDPEKVTNLRTTVDSIDGAMIEWSGTARMTSAEFTELFNSLKLQIG